MSRMLQVTIVMPLDGVVMRVPRVQWRLVTLVKPKKIMILRSVEELKLEIKVQVIVLPSVMVQVQLVTELAWILILIRQEH